MILDVVFQSTSVGISETKEPACLGMVGEHILVILISSTDTNSEQKNALWYLEAGFGPCDQQGIMFETLDDASSWIRSRLEEASFISSSF